MGQLVGPLSLRYMYKIADAYRRTNKQRMPVANRQKRVGSLVRVARSFHMKDEGLIQSNEVARRDFFSSRPLLLVHRLTVQDGIRRSAAR